MKKIFIFGLLAFGSLVRASDDAKLTVKMPNERVLSERLAEAGFDHFMEKTAIHKKLADKSIYPAGVNLTVELALYDYAENLKNPMIASLMRMRKPQLMEIILKDSPAAIEELKLKGAL